MDTLLLPAAGLRAFLERHCSDTDRLLAALSAEPRLVNLLDGERLCARGDLADCVWIVEDGHLRVETAGLIAARGPGDIVGEMAFFRDREDARRGTDVASDGRCKVWRIDRSAIESLASAERSLWFETIGRVLVAKLDQATEQRAVFLREVSKAEGIVKRLVCREGVEATMAALLFDADAPIPMARKRAVVWFSDVAGFSALSERLQADEIGSVLRSVIGPQVEEIEAAGGQVDKYMGDGVMAFWLCPDDARLARATAAAAASALRAAARVREVAERECLEVGLRIGLHAGEVAVGDFGGAGRIAFTLVGQAVNAAARYEQFKPKPGDRDGAVRLSDAVYGLLPEGGRDGFHPEPVTFADKHDRRFVAYLSHP